MKLPQTIQGLFRQTGQDWIMQARKTARDLLLKRYSITIEDVLEACPRPRYLHRNLTGNVFRDDVFIQIGYTRSRRSIQHSSTIRLWTLNDDYFSPEQLRGRNHRVAEYENE